MDATSLLQTLRIHHKSHQKRSRLRLTYIIANLVMTSRKLILGLYCFHYFHWVVVCLFVNATTFKDMGYTEGSAVTVWRCGAVGREMDLQTDYALSRRADQFVFVERPEGREGLAGDCGLESYNAVLLL